MKLPNLDGKDRIILVLIALATLQLASLAGLSYQLTQANRIAARAMAEVRTAQQTIELWQGLTEEIAQAASDRCFIETFPALPLLFGPAERRDAEL